MYALVVKFAVIGSGIAGLSAAWLLSQKHDVTLLEKESDIGMGFHGIEVDGLPVDTPMRVFNPMLWKELAAFAEHLNLESFAVDVACSFSTLEGKTLFRYTNIGQEDKYWPVGISPRFAARYLQTLYNVIKMRKDTDPTHTLRDHLAVMRFNENFVLDYLLPMLGTICTCSNDALLNYPAQVIASELKNILVPTSLRRLKGGTQSVVAAIKQSLANIRTGTEVSRLEYHGDGVLVHHKGSEPLQFDHVVIATQANHAHRLLPEGHNDDATLLRTFEYEENAIAVHTDERFMPQRHQDRSPLNFMLSENKHASMSTIDIGAIDQWPTDTTILQTWNPLFEPEKEKTLLHVRLERPVVTFESMRANEKMAEGLNDSARRIWFTGSYATKGIPLLETGVRSSIALAARHGVIAPWACGRKEHHVA